MMTNEANQISVEAESKVYPPYDDFHGTPGAMLWRQVLITTSSGSATLEQTDYGHPGRLNDWEPRGMAAGLAPRLSELRAVAEALGKLM
jgi:hypothetical protein